MIRALILALVSGACAASAFAQNAPTEPPPEQALEVFKVQGNVWMIAGAGGNIAVQAGEQGVVVVDTGASEITDKVMAEYERELANPSGHAPAATRSSEEHATY